MNCLMVSVGRRRISGLQGSTLSKVAKVERADRDHGQHMIFRLPFGAATEAQRRTEMVRISLPQRRFQVATVDFDLPVVMNGSNLHLDDRLPRNCQLEQSEGDFRRFASAIHQVACDV